MTNFESKLKEAARKYSEPFKRGREFKKLSEYARADFTNGALYAESELNAKILLLERENRILREALQTINTGIDPRSGKWSEQFQDTMFKPFTARTASDYAGETLSTLTKSKGGVSEA